MCVLGIKVDAFSYSFHLAKLIPDKQTTKWALEIKLLSLCFKASTLLTELLPKSMPFIFMENQHTRHRDSEKAVHVKTPLSSSFVCSPYLL